MKKPNLDLRYKWQSKGLKQYEIADALQVGEATFCRWLRYELTDEKRNRIEQAIKELSQGR